MTDDFGEGWQRWREQLAASQATREAKRTRYGRGFGIALTVAYVGAILAGLGIPVYKKWADRVQYPKMWDRKIETVAQEVELLRGLRFKRPVFVKSIEPTTFDKLVSSDQDTTWDSELKGSTENYVFVCSKDGRGQWAPCSSYSNEIDPGVEVLKLIGVVDANFPVPHMPLSVSDATILARYNSKKKRVEIRGSVEGVTKSVLAHELTHVLQDQHFGLDCDCRTWDELFAHQSLTEGDASRVEGLYTSTQTATEVAAERNVVERLDAETSDRLDQAISTSPYNPDMNELQFRQGLFPYEDGKAFVDAIVSGGGQAALDSAYRSPPRSTAEIFRRRIQTKRVTVAEVSLSGRPYTPKPTQIGVWYWREALRRKGFESSIEAITSSWAGEATSVEQRDNKLCFADRIVLQGPQAKAAATAFRKLVSTMADGTFTDELDNDVPSVVVGGCTSTMFQKSLSFEQLMKERLRKRSTDNGPPLPKENPLQSASNFRRPQNR